MIALLSVLHSLFHDRSKMRFIANDLIDDPLCRIPDQSFQNAGSDKMSDARTRAFPGIGTTEKAQPPDYLKYRCVILHLWFY